MSRDKFIVDAEDLEWFTAKPPEGQKPGKGAEKSKKPVDAPSAGEAVTQNFDDITVIRFENFNKLLDEFRQQFHDEPERGMFTRFAEKLGISPRYLSHIRNGRKNIGHRTARAMEKAFGHPTGWLDQPSVFLEIEDDEAEFVEVVIALYRSLPKGARSSLLEFCKVMVQNNN